MRPEERDASAVYFAPVSDADDEHGYLLVQHFVDDTVIPDTQPPQAGELALESAAGERFAPQAIDRLNQSRALGFGDSAQRLCSASLDLDREAHASRLPNPRWNRRDPGAARGRVGDLRRHRGNTRPPAE